MLKKNVLTLTMTMATLAAALPLHASDITWQPAQNISGDSDINTNGTYVDAATFYNPDNASPIVPYVSAAVNGVNFNALQADGTSPDPGPQYPGYADATYTDGLKITAQAPNYSPTYGAFGSTPPAGLSTGYTKILSTIGYGYYLRGIVTMSGLNPGDNYQVQVFSSYSGDLTLGATYLDSNVSNVLHPVNNQYSIGTFTAPGATESFTFDLGGALAGGGSGVYAVINAVSLRDLSAPAVPEPASLSLLALSSTLLLRRRRHA